MTTDNQTDGSIVEPFNSAYRTYVESGQRRQDKALRRYLKATRRAWKKTDVSRLSADALAAICQQGLAVSTAASGQSQQNTSLPGQSAPASPFHAAPASPFYAAPASPFHAAPASPFYAAPASPFYAAPASPFYAAPASPFFATASNTFGDGD